MKFVVVALLAIISIVVANPYSQAVSDATNTLRAKSSKGVHFDNSNTLDLSGSYNWAFSVTDQIKAQIKANQDAIAALLEAVNQAEQTKIQAFDVWQAAQDQQNQAQSDRDNARGARDLASEEYARATEALRQANDALDQAQTELRQAQAEFEKRNSAYKTATNIRDVEQPFKEAEINEFKKILEILGQQHTGTAPTPVAPICRKENVCAPEPAPLAKLYRYWNPGNSDHFYTTNWNEIGNGKYGWGFEGVEGYCSATQIEGTLPLYRYWNPSHGDHFYTTNFGELGQGASGWTLEGTACYVFEKPVAGTTPLHRYWNGGSVDHFYTTNWNEIGNGKYGYVYEGVAGYVGTADKVSIEKCKVVEVCN